ncbi:flagellar basal-body MS-ring/collar protein FliF [Methyloraptor flagellatus]|uniref:Flagellar M-ring protein n=1 Tax=Methyloraptor flagellatus TaxID=3162530 RepID=A0AAU7XB52_9HYPH
MNGALEFLQKLGPARVAAMGAVAIALVGFFAFLILRVSQPNMAVMYSDLSVQDSAAIVKELDAQAITYELRQDGSQIMVPKDQMLRLRMRLAEKGIPSGGSVGYDIFDKSDALGTTSFVQNINRLRALEGELSRTIRAIDRIQAARVHLNIPDRQVFQRDKREPTASIVLKVRGQLEQQQIRSIQHLVASAIEGLKPNRVTVVDEGGRLLASGGEEDAQGLVSATLQERNAAYERRIEGQIESIVSSIVGQGRARVRVTAEMDYSRVTQTQDSFDPNGQVVRSTQTKEENSSNVQGDKQVTVANQVPGGTQDQNKDSSKEASNTSEETVNYEISKTSRVEVMEAGRVKKMSVAVLVDGVYTAANGAEPTYQPRPQADLDRIAALVRSAVGFDQNRGDQVEVVNLRFAEAPASLPLESQKQGLAGLFDFTKDDIMRLAELGVLFVMSLLVFFFGLRPLIKKVLGPEVVKTTILETTVTGAAGAAGAAGGQLALAGPDGQPAVGPDGQPIERGTLEDAAATALAGAGLIPADRLEQAKALGEMHATSIAKIGELITESPAEAAAIIRGWLAETAA